MRDIWFRTYQPHSGAMEYITLQELADGEHFDFDYESFHWMQYTGFKDAKGKDIYEGDILCVLEDVVADTIDGYDLHEQEGDFMEVIFDKYGRWSVKGNNMVNGELLYDMLSDAQILGNIYQNPDLIK